MRVHKAGLDFVSVSEFREPLNALAGAQNTRRIGGGNESHGADVCLEATRRPQAQVGPSLLTATWASSPAPPPRRAAGRRRRRRRIRRRAQW